jgi:hypothetical protein
VRLALLAAVGLLAAGCGGASTGGPPPKALSREPLHLVHPRLGVGIRSPLVPRHGEHETITFPLVPGGRQPPSALAGGETRLQASVSLGGRPLPYAVEASGSRYVAVDFDLPKSSAGERLVVTAYVTVAGLMAQSRSTMLVR